MESLQTSLWQDPFEINQIRNKNENSFASIKSVQSNKRKSGLLYTVHTISDLYNDNMFFFYSLYFCLAIRFREKRKKKIIDLMQQDEELSMINKDLKSQIKILEEEILKLKSCILAHNNCNCAIIQNYRVSKLL